MTVNMMYVYTLKHEDGPLVPPFLPLAPPPPPPPPPSCSRDIAVWKLSSRKVPYTTSNNNTSKRVLIATQKVSCYSKGVLLSNRKHYHLFIYN